MPPCLGSSERTGKDSEGASDVGRAVWLFRLQEIAGYTSISRLSIGEPGTLLEGRSTREAESGNETGEGVQESRLMEVDSDDGMGLRQRKRIAVASRVVARLQLSRRWVGQGNWYAVRS